jgi:hypothetical protein
MANDFTTGATSAMHSFRAYVMRNPYKSVEAMTADDFDNMFNGFVEENSEISATASFEDAAGTGTLSFPGNIAAADAQANADQADYPEKHFKKAKYGA